MSSVEYHNQVYYQAYFSAKPVKGASPTLPTASNYDWGGNNNDQQADFFSDFSTNKKQVQIYRDASIAALVDYLSFSQYY